MEEIQIEKKENVLKDLIQFALIVLLVVLPIRLFIAQPFIVVGQSMEPTFETNQYLLVDELTYRLESPKRDQVVVFEYPYKKDMNSSSENGKAIYYIKRIIGLPGETVQIKDGNVTIINKEHPEGFALSEPYLSTIKNERSFTNLTTTLKDNEYFVMGDNRGNSSDSRDWGPLEKKFIVGRAFVRLLPPQKISFLPGN